MVILNIYLKANSKKMQNSLYCYRKVSWLWHHIYYFHVRAGRQTHSQQIGMKSLIPIFGMILERWVQESLWPKDIPGADSELTIHSITLWIPNIKAGSFHVARKDIPPFIFKPKRRLHSCWTWPTFYERQVK